MLDLGALDIKVQLLNSMVFEYRAQIEVLSDLSTYLVRAHFAVRESHADLLDQHLALRECLYKTGLIAQEDLLAYVRAKHSAHCFHQLLGELQPARLLLQNLGVSAARILLATSCSGAKLLSGVAQQCAGLRGMKGGKHAADGCSMKPGVQTPLLDLWRISALADRLNHVSGTSAVLQLRAISSAGRERLQSVHSRTTLRQLRAVAMSVPKKDLDGVVSSNSKKEHHPPHEGLRRSDIGEGDDLVHFCTFLQDIWQYTTLGDALIFSMDKSSVRQFRVLSRACCECMRSHRSSKPGPDSRRDRAANPSSPIIALLPATQETAVDTRQFDTECHGERGDIPATGQCRGSAGEAHVDTNGWNGNNSKELCAPLRLTRTQEKPCSADRPQKCKLEAHTPIIALAGAADLPEGREPMPGRLVRLKGLQRASHLNDKIGRLVRCYELSRFALVLLSTGEHIRVRRANVELIVGRRQGGKQGSAEGLELLPPDRVETSPRLGVLSDVIKSRNRATSIHDVICGVAGLLRQICRCAGPFTLRLIAGVSRFLFRSVWRQGKLYVCGGSDSNKVLSSVECLDLTTGTWHPVPSMMGARDSAASAVVAGQFYICGGSDGDRWLSSMERFDPRSGGWESMPPMSTPRTAAGAGVIAGRIYLVGGQFHVPLRSCECFDPVDRSWRRVARMEDARALPMVAVAGGRLYACGGADLDFLTSVECLDPIAGAWEMLPRMSEKRYLGAVAAERRCIYICGGYNGANMEGAERYNLDTAAWEPLPPMLQGRRGAVAVGRGEGIVVCGGCSRQGTWAEALDFGASSWQALQTSILKNRENGVALVAAGRLYICGGADTDGPVSATELLDIASGRCELLPPMIQPRIKASGFYTFF
mmetsp:Transcript_58074/g.169800  ORF Transcript_58074/g.169800 Transcript_58074/m.169800 type:complete len:877 (-) Transcript_58074:97-2727(-)